MPNTSTRTALGTGASRGIGSGGARRLAQDGFGVVVNYAGSEAEASAVVKQINADKGRAISAQADVSKPVEVARMFDAAEEEFGGVDVLVNNAGLMTLSSIATTDDATFDRLVAVNLKGTFNGLREAAKRLRTGGRIINFSTSVIGTSLETYGIYAATKSAIENLTAILPKELPGRSITVNAIAPGPTGTALFSEGKCQQPTNTMPQLH